jgi:hypothetical protein
LRTPSKSDFYAWFFALALSNHDIIVVFFYYFVIKKYLFYFLKIIFYINILKQTKNTKKKISKENFKKIQIFSKLFLNIKTDLYVQRISNKIFSLKSPTLLALLLFHVLYLYASSSIFNRNFPLLEFFFI